MDYGKINARDIPAPYDVLVGILTIEEIIRLAENIKGLQIYFRNGEYEHTKAFDIMSCTLGRHKAIMVCRMYSGDSVYFPSINHIYREQMQRQIKSEFDGYNVTELAIRYSLSEKHVRNIVGGTKSRNRPIEGQISIFDYE